MIPFAAKAELKAALAIALAAAIFSAGFFVEGWRKDAEIADLEAENAKFAKAVAEASARRLTKAQTVSDDLLARLTASEDARLAILEEKNRELHRLTVGRPCLGGAAVRVLNLPDGLKPGAVTQAASESVPADAGFATDTDVAEWAGACRRSYDTCRGRLAAIANFYAGVRDE